MPVVVWWWVTSIPSLFGCLFVAGWRSRELGVGFLRHDRDDEGEGGSLFDLPGDTTSCDVNAPVPGWFKVDLVSTVPSGAMWLNRGSFYLGTWG